MDDKDKTTIEVSIKNRNELMKKKYDYDLDNVDAVITRLLENGN